MFIKLTLFIVQMKILPATKIFYQIQKRLKLLELLCSTSKINFKIVYFIKASRITFYGYQEKSIPIEPTTGLVVLRVQKIIFDLNTIFFLRKQKFIKKYSLVLLVFKLIAKINKLFFIVR